MPKYQISRNVVSAQGFQVFECEARNVDEAYQKFSSGKDSFVTEEIEVTELGSVCKSEIEEVDDESI